MEIKGKVNTDTINAHKGELMEYKNQTENRAFQEMLQAAVKRLQNRSGEDLAAKSGTPPSSLTGTVNYWAHALHPTVNGAFHPGPLLRRK